MSKRERQPSDGTRKALASIERKLDLVLRHLQHVEIQGEKMAADLTSLTEQVKQNTDVEGSAVTLLTGLSAQIASLKNDPVAIQDLADKLRNSASALASAVTANTPAVNPAVNSATKKKS